MSVLDDITHTPARPCAKKVSHHLVPCEALPCYHPSCAVTGNTISLVWAVFQLKWVDTVFFAALVINYMIGVSLLVPLCVRAAHPPCRPPSLGCALHRWPLRLCFAVAIVIQPRIATRQTRQTDIPSAIFLHLLTPRSRLPAHLLTIPRSSCSASSTSTSSAARLPQPPRQSSSLCVRLP